MEHNETAPLAPSIADLIYARRTAIEQATPGAPRLGLHQLAEFLSRDDATLTIEQQRALFANPRLRADFRRLKDRFEMLPLPALIAASNGSTVERRFDSGSVRVHPSRLPQQVYVIIRFTLAAAPPRTLLLESEAGEIVKRSLPAPDANGDVMIICDTRQDADATFVLLVSDPMTVGSFLV